MIILSILLLHNAVGIPIGSTSPEDIDPEYVLTVTVKENNTADAITFLSKDLNTPRDRIVIVSQLGRVIQFAVIKSDDSFQQTDQLVSALKNSDHFDVVSPTFLGNGKEEDSNTSETDVKLLQKPWFVALVAAVSGLIMFLLVVPPVYWCMLHNRKADTSELQKLDSANITKRYDTISRDGSIQSRRKLAPNILTLTTITQPSTESSDSDTSPPGVKEALQSRTSPLTPLQLRQRLDNPALLYAEFCAMPTNEETRTVKKSSLKNRYKGVLPNLPTRVRLKAWNAGDEVPCDYINANYIKGYKGIPRVYIATQGPLKNTVNDFWSMIWQEKVTTIVMITKLQEKGRNKCVIYWPDKSSTYNNLTVTVRDSTQYEGFTVTSMFITDGLEVHRICHLWMWSWPDQGVPDSSRSLLAMLSCVHSIWRTGTSPLVVHCSAGLGRTGCFIAVDIGIQSLKHDRVVDVLKITAALRLDRGGMIQTLEQYEFVHRALLRHEMATRNKHRFKGLRKSSFSHEGAPEVLYSVHAATTGTRRMSCSVSSSHIMRGTQVLDILGSSSLPTYISTLLSTEPSDLPSPDSPKPPSLLQLSKLMEKTSKRRISHLKRTAAVDFSTDVDCLEYSPPCKFLAADDSSPEFLKTPMALTKSSFSLDLGREMKRDLPRSASEDTPDNSGTSGPAEGASFSCNNSSLDSFSSRSVSNSVPCFTFDFEDIPDQLEVTESPTYVNTFVPDSPYNHDSLKSIPSINS